MRKRPIDLLRGVGTGVLLLVGASLLVGGVVSLLSGSAWGLLSLALAFAFFLAARRLHPEGPLHVWWLIAGALLLVGVALAISTLAAGLVD